MRRAKTRLWLLVALFVALGVSATSEAVETLFIGTGFGTACQRGTETGCPTSPGFITDPKHVSVFNNQGTGGDPTSELGLSPLLLIVGIPFNGTGTASAPTISSVTEYVPGNTAGTTFSTPGTARTFGIGGGPFFGGTWNTTTNPGFGGSMFPPPPAQPDAYEIVTLPGGSDSENRSNWFGSAVPPPPGRFDLFVYHLDGQINNKGLFDIVFDGSGLAVGTYVIAYGCDATTTGSNDGSCTSEFSTPFTHAGLVVPEPTSLLLLGSGLIGLGFAGRKRSFTTFRK